jgi:hypothetical protein
MSIRLYKSYTQVHEIEHFQRLVKAKLNQKKV